MRSIMCMSVITKKRKKIVWEQKKKKANQYRETGVLQMFEFTFANLRMCILTFKCNCIKQREKNLQY